MISDLTSAALRVYLTYLLQQTEEILDTCKFQISITVVRISAFNQHWKLALDIAVELSTSIKDCLKNISCDVDSLCVVDSLQDALREAMERAKNGDALDEKSHGRLSRVHSTRANYLTYGIAARNGDSPELSSLWFLAATFLQRRLDLKLSLSITESLCEKAKEHLKAASLVERNGLYVKNAQYHKNIVLHYHYAAALSAVGRPHSHDYAAELFQKAASASNTIAAMKDPGYYRRNEAAVPGELVLWERTAASWRQAAELAAAQATGSNTVREDPAIRSVVAVAEKSAANVKKLSNLMATVVKYKDIAVTTKNNLAVCRAPRMLPWWRDLATRQEHAIPEAERCVQSFIDGEMDAEAAALSLTAVFSGTENRAGNLRELQMFCTKAQLYKQKAAPLQQEKEQLAVFAKKCWAQAAAYMEEAIKMYIEDIAAGVVHWLCSERTQKRRFYASLTDDCVSIAENVMGSAGEYLDKARGAEAGVKNGRDPREAQMWRNAADCQMQKAAALWAETLVREKKMDPFARNSNAITQLDKNIMSFVQMAEYLQLAYQHRALPDGARVALLYERTVEFMMLRADATDPAPLGRLINQHLALIHDLNESDRVPAKVIAVRSLICEYGQQAHAAADPDIQNYWSKANDLLHCTLTKCTSQSRALSRETSARLYECAAREEKLSWRLCFEAAARACEDAFCAGMDPNVDDSDFEEEMEEEEKVLALYQNTVARFILSLGDVNSAVPPEITIFFDQVQHQCAEEERESMTSEAEEHAKYVMLQNHCKCMCAQLSEDDSALDAWNETQHKVEVLLSLFHQRAVDAYQFFRACIHHDARISFHVLVVKCHVAFAESPPDSIAAAAWQQAVEICQKSASITSKDKFIYDQAIAEVERAVQVAQKRIMDDK